MYKVVIIDDEFVIRDGMCSIVNWEKYDCEVVGTADDGLEGKKIIETLQPDIIFVDIHMPNCDGLKMLEALKDTIKDTQVTIMTGFGEFTYAKQAIKLGVTRYLMKPSQMDEIEDAMACMVENLNIKTGKLYFKTENFLVNSVLKAVDERYDMKLTLTDIAEENQVSVCHLSKLISKYCDKTFKEILNETRIKSAKKILLSTNLKVYEVSEKVGITDVTYFSKIFKKYADGMLPNEYRNNPRKI